jgi:hypothetical protein
MGKAYTPPLGAKFNQLTVASDTKIKIRTLYAVLCTCDCGKTTIVTISNLTLGRVKSCGCARRRPRIMPCTKKENPANQIPNYAIWLNMRQRCTNPKNVGYMNYGGRGIKICDRWLGEDGLKNFNLDMGARPSRQHSIDRIDNNGNYEPSNCRWATNTEQLRNRRNNRWLTYNGKTMLLTDWASLFRISSGALTTAISRRGSFELTAEFYLNRNMLII